MSSQNSCLCRTKPDNDDDDDHDDDEHDDDDDDDDRLHYDLFLLLLKLVSLPSD